jgi:hypothetical protein
MVLEIDKNPAPLAQGVGFLKLEPIRISQFKIMF